MSGPQSQSEEGEYEGSRPFPKKEIRSGAGGPPFMNVQKSSIAPSIHARFASRLAGSTAVDGWQGMVPFLISISQISRLPIPNRTIK